MKLFSKLTQTARYMLLSLAVLFAAFALLGGVIIRFVFPFEPLPRYLAGLLLGCVVTAVRLVMMDYAIGKEVGMPEAKAKNYHQLMFFLRYALLIAFAVVLVVFSGVFGVFGGVIGILCMQLSAYGAHMLLSCRDAARKKQGDAPSGTPPEKPEEK